MTAPLKTVAEPQLSDVLQSLKTDIFRSLNCVRLAEIVAFDAGAATAQVKILGRRVLPDGSTRDYPPLLDCPVFTLQGGSFAVRLPIAAGDQGVLLISDRNIDSWFKTGAAMDPASARCHDLSDGIMLVGVNALTRALASVPDGEARFGSELAFFGANALGLLTVQNAATSLLLVLTNLIAVLSAATLNVPGNSLSAPTIAALATIQLELETLLY